MASARPTEAMYVFGETKVDSMEHLRGSALGASKHSPPTREDIPAKIQQRNKRSSFERFGPYVLEERLGRGGMAEVFTARHVGAAGFERTVCLKKILPQLSMDGDFRELFTREARVAGRLSHNNIVQFHDCIEDGHALALVMEFVDGMDLRAMIKMTQERRRPIPVSIIAYVAGQILSGLKYAHSKQVIHRDISPHNILLSKNGEVKLADFGVAKAMLTQATRTGDLKGKLAYMSPEQALGSKIDHRTDLYSAGLVLYELLKGKRFFKKATRSELVGLVTHAKQPTLEKDVPELARLIERLLAPHREDRYPTAEAALAELPPWNTVGPAGAIELADFLESLLSDRSSDKQDPIWNGAAEAFGLTPQSVPSEKKSAPRNAVPSNLALERTEKLDEGQSRRERLDRPVVPVGPNAPTATRDADIHLAIALAPTQMFDENEDLRIAPDTLEDEAYEVTQTGLLAKEERRRRKKSLTAHLEALLPGGSKSSPKDRLFRLIGVAAVLSLLIGLALGAGGRLLFNRTPTASLPQSAVTAALNDPRPIEKISTQQKPTSTASQTDSARPSEVDGSSRSASQSSIDTLGQLPIDRGNEPKGSGEKRPMLSWRSNGR